MPKPDPQRPLTLHIGRDELILRQRYEVISIVNDLLIAVWFIIGSIMFFFSELMVAGTWCFLAGSVELLIRPLIRLTRQVHVQRLQARGAGSGLAPGSSQDF
ncbi:YrhK family protein [Nocardiopsis kunsanensis]|uniref:YrhK domain-containing protein n=1 Tax=Nocardiopsis kunsanensis TaxID=141693 RepID=A0A919CJP1_9ACTN|nr:YrhK family protein [Nocardiopsis kunsanensis]GHD28970.1 hypothetical protein GCM10007147_29330 [Nocardiopsis kunsanensis]